MPSVDMFRRSYPEDAYRLPDTAYTAEELTGSSARTAGSTLPGWPSIDIADAGAARTMGRRAGADGRAARIIRDDPSQRRASPWHGTAPTTT